MKGGGSDPEDGPYERGDIKDYPGRSEKEGLMVDRGLAVLSSSKEGKAILEEMRKKKRPSKTLKTEEVKEKKEEGGIEDGK